MVQGCHKCAGLSGRCVLHQGSSTSDSGTLRFDTSGVTASTVLKTGADWNITVPNGSLTIETNGKLSSNLTTATGLRDGARFGDHTVDPIYDLREDGDKTPLAYSCRYCDTSVSVGGVIDALGDAATARVREWVYGKFLVHDCN